ncbi:hypothetical protein NP233_g9784 [Leucocoprinus birnbaumii]|uniref:Uncharacterized protein n=1 Tax=Leucocoprinus birnbaumii TaxID=56174 RepID=A0AAD5VJT4_9AGAR|nr:hypothetical protein NP233_g9784 [Leucocoprinus birnbaumii]
MSASPECSALFTTSTDSPLKELDVSTFYPYLNSPLEELQVSTFYPYLDSPLEELRVSTYHPYLDSPLEELDAFAHYPYLDSILFRNMTPSVGSEGLGPDQLNMPELVQDDDDQGRVVLYEEVIFLESPSEYDG